MYSGVCYMVGEYEKNMCFELTKNWYSFEKKYWHEFDLQINCIPG